MNNKINSTNNYEDQSTNEPMECPECFSSMTQNLWGDYFTCDGDECTNEVNLEGEQEDE